MTISIGDYSIREIIKDDLPKLLEWRNSDKIKRNMLDQHVITLEEHMKWFVNISQYEIPQNFVNLYKGNIVGYCGIKKNNIKKTYTRGMYIGDDSNLPVVAFLYYSCLINYVIFDVLKMDYFETDILADNKKVVRFNNIMGAKLLKEEEYKIETANGIKTVFRFRHYKKNCQNFMNKFVLTDQLIITQ